MLQLIKRDAIFDGLRGEVIKITKIKTLALKGHIIRGTGSQLQ